MTGTIFLRALGAAAGEAVQLLRGIHEAPPEVREARMFEGGQRIFEKPGPFLGYGCRVLAATEFAVWLSDITTSRRHLTLSQS